MTSLNCFLILAGLTGVCYCRKTTINEVQVVRGASISIPCLYDSKYEKHVKYLCKGHYWRSCSYAVKTNKLDTNGNFLIQDVKEQKTFTVTINHVDTDSYYWCVVEIDGGADDREFFHLSVSSTPALRVDRQKMEGFRGGNITINCYSRSSGMRKWCKLGGNCVTSSFQLVDGRKVIINKNHSVYSVTMIGLKQENSGWYWCDQGQFQMPVHLTVTERPATTLKSVTVTVATTVTNVTQPSVKERTDPTILFISLGVLIVIVLVACLVWFVLKGRQAKTEPDMEKTEDKVVYSDVTFQKKKTTEIAPESDVNVIYSSVVSLKQQDRRVKQK
ncbi:Polymeric immunoglobulin receptor [Oryzias melastigma]|uniref:polymeric immunoglobulin receptor isoform X1 n=1 Tax=Oryzias melastigma TaxID=30732 RepID=UPI000CF7EC64|nr:polymeric immunoglobulin receptor isoform X1 [Oryzias melastigma]KAF6716481.1 Polymeric immunoglobulin receptor [Oryzias melastigma]